VSSLLSNGPLVSVIITSFNYGELLGRAIESVLSQTYQNLQVIVADDCSEDDSVQVATNYAAIDNRVVLLQNKTTLRLAKNKQAACIAADGEFLTFLDADDYFSATDKIESELRIILSHEEEGGTCVAYSVRRWIDSEGHLIALPDPLELPEGMVFRKILLRETQHMPRDFLVRSEAFWSVGGFDTNSKLFVDYILKIRLAKIYPFYSTGKEGIHSFRHGSGMASASRAEYRKAIWHAYVGHRDLVDNSRQLLSADLSFFAKNRPRLHLRKALRRNRVLRKMNALIYAFFRKSFLPNPLSK